MFPASLIFFGVFVAATFAEADPIAIKQPELAKDLRTRVEWEQRLRKESVEFCLKHKLTEGNVDLESLDPKVAAIFNSLKRRLEDADSQNLFWLKEIVTKHGWPSKSLVGGQGAKDAWILVQHADTDRDFQQKCLDQMKALPKDEVDPRDTAYLTDRVLVGTGKQQLYGTQVIIKNGKFVPNPIENPDKVDERRKAIGMESLQEYLKFVEQAFLPAEMK
ncbi:MAG TPA: DUF6624 domain-containing protein [Schlesneria sp.]|jgi:hypothetical protein